MNIKGISFFILALLLPKTVVCFLAYLSNTYHFWIFFVQLPSVQHYFNCFFACDIRKSHVLHSLKMKLMHRTDSSRTVPLFPTLFIECSRSYVINQNLKMKQRTRLRRRPISNVRQNASGNVYYLFGTQED